MPAANVRWLDDYALFRALKDAHGGVAWNEWEPALVRRDAAALGARSRATSTSEIEAQKFYQFLFFRQWFALKAYCNERGIKLVGDIPIFVAHDSADVWTNPDQFKLNEDGTSDRRGRRAARLLQRHRPALGQSALQLGPNARGRIQVVD